MMPVATIPAKSENGSLRAATPTLLPSTNRRSKSTTASSTATNCPQNCRIVAGALLQLHAATLDDLEKVRIATENRLRAMRDDHGLGELPEYRRAEAIREALAAAEHQATLELQRAMRKHPLGEWVKGQVGIGEKQGARLIAAIGDPAWNGAEDRPRRGPAELWAYCGYHTLAAGGQNRFETQAGRVPGGRNIAARRRKGQKANWNAEAKMRAYLCAESCIKQSASPYRAVYDRARLKARDAVHNEPCPRCGPSGHPALAGSPISDGHAHARGLREVAKAILRDLFLAAREVAS